MKCFIMVENELQEMAKMTVSRENIDKQLNHYATILTLLVKIKEKFEEVDELEDVSDAESLIDTDDIEPLTDTE